MGKGGRPFNLGEIPHFSGDFWPAEAESILRELEGFNEVEDDPDEGMRKWWQDLTRRDLDRGKASKKRKAEVLEETAEKDSKPWSKYDRPLVAKIPKAMLKHVKDIGEHSNAVNDSTHQSRYKTVKVTAKTMETPIKWILKRRESDRRAWQEQVRKMRISKPK